MKITYERALKGSKDEIIEMIDKTFSPMYFPTFTFKEVTPKVYKGNNVEEIHHLLRDESGNLIGASGNLIEDYIVNEKIYKTSFLGSVSIKKEYEGLGLMKRLMEKMEEENREKDIPFSFLTGNRNRYEYYSYYLTGMEYLFSFIKGNFKHEKDYVKYPELRLVRANKKDIESMYQLYLEKNDFVIRRKETFYYSLANHYCLPYKIMVKDELVGYFTISKKQKRLADFLLIDEKYLLDVMSNIFDIFKIENLNISVNGYNYPFINTLLKYAEDYTITKDVNVKVYDYKAFLEFVFDINKNKKFEDGSLILTIEDDTNIKIDIKDNEVKIDYVPEGGVRLTKKEFMELFSMDYIVKDLHIKSWFPLPLSILNCDTF